MEISNQWRQFIDDTPAFNLFKFGNNQENNQTGRAEKDPTNNTDPEPAKEITNECNFHAVIIKAKNLTSVTNILEPNPFVTCTLSDQNQKTAIRRHEQNPIFDTPLSFEKIDVSSTAVCQFSVLDANTLISDDSFGFAEIKFLEGFEQDGELRAFIEKLRFMKATATIPQVYQEDAIDERGVWCRIDPESKELVHLLVRDVWLPLEGVSQGELHVRLVLEARIKPDGGNLNSPRHPLDPIVYSDEVVASFEEARRARLLHSPCKELFYPSVASEVSHEVRCILSARHAKLVEERQFWRWTRALTKNPHILYNPQPHEYYKQEFSNHAFDSSDLNETTSFGGDEDHQIRSITGRRPSSNTVVGAIAGAAIATFSQSSELSNLIRRGLPSNSACSHLSPLVLPDGSEGGTSRGSQHLPKVRACVEGHKVVLNQYALYKVNAFVSKGSQGTEWTDDKTMLETKSCVWRRYSDFTTLARVENKPFDNGDLLKTIFNSFDEDFLCSRQAAVDTFLQELLASQQSGSSHLSPTTIEFLGLTCAPPSLFPMLENVRMHVWLSLSGGAELALTKKIGYSFSELKVAAFSKQIWINGLLGDSSCWESCEREAFVEIDLDLERTSGGWEKWSHHEGGEALSDTEKHSLRTVLRAIALAVPSVGYCQSMNFIGLMILRNVCNGLDAEENAFYILLAFVSCVAPRYFNHTMDAARTDLVLFEMLINEYLSDLSGQILSLGIPLELVASPWLLGLLSQDDFFPPHVVMRVWDWMVLDGVDVIIYVLLAFLRKLSPVILQSQDINTCIAEIRSQATNWLDAEELIELAEREVATVGGGAKLASLRAKITKSHSSNTDIAAAKHHLLAKTKTLTQYLVQGFKNPCLLSDEIVDQGLEGAHNMEERDVLGGAYCEDTNALDLVYVGFVCEVLAEVFEVAYNEEHGIMFDQANHKEEDNKATVLGHRRRMSPATMIAAAVNVISPALTSPIQEAHRTPHEADDEIRVNTVGESKNGGVGITRRLSPAAMSSSLKGFRADVNIRIHRARLKLFNKLAPLTITGETLAVITERAIQTICEAKLSNNGNNLSVPERSLSETRSSQTIGISHEISNLIQEVVSLNSVQGSQFFSNALQFVCALVVLGPLPPHVKMKLCFSTLIYAHRAASSSSSSSSTTSSTTSSSSFKYSCGIKDNDLVLMILSGSLVHTGAESAMNSEKVPLKECVDLIHFLVVLTQPSRAQGDVESCLDAVAFNAWKFLNSFENLTNIRQVRSSEEGLDSVAVPTSSSTVTFVSLSALAPVPSLLEEAEFCVEDQRLHRANSGSTVTSIGRSSEASDIEEREEDEDEETKYFDNNTEVQSIAGYLLQGRYNDATVLKDFSHFFDNMAMRKDRVLNSFEVQQHRVESALSDDVDDIPTVTTGFRFNEKTLTIEMNCEMFCQVIDSHPLSKACFKNGLD